MSDAVLDMMSEAFPPLVSYWKQFLEQNPDAHATIDFETRSEADLKKVGSWNYSRDPSTEILCMYYHLPDSDNVHSFYPPFPQMDIPGTPQPLSLFAFIKAGGLVEAHNAFFEKCIWHNLCVPRLGWPDIAMDNWRCSLAKCSAYGLPRSLEGAGRALGLDIQKDTEGRRIMLKLCKPRKPRKKEIAEWVAAHGNRPMPTLYYEDREEFLRLFEYCGRDVASEVAISKSVPDLSAIELKLWQIDQKANWEGVKIDVELAEAALKMFEMEKTRLNKRLKEITGVPSGTARTKLKNWLLHKHGIALDDTQADTLEWYVDNLPDIPAEAREVLQIMVNVYKTSTRKYKRMLELCDPLDHRVRDILMYHGAHTGRWSGKGIQVQNYPSRGLIVKDQVQAAEDIKSLDLEWCHMMYGDVMKLLSHTLRGAIIPGKGKKFFIADFSAIEARVVAWLAGDNRTLDVFRSGGDIYCDMASAIYGKKINKKDHPEERSFGKAAVLGLAYQMGYITFLLQQVRGSGIHFTKEQAIAILGRHRYDVYTNGIRSALNLDKSLTEKEDKAEAARNIKRLVDGREKPEEILHELAVLKYTVDLYRETYEPIKNQWKRQENAAIEALLHKGRKVRESVVTCVFDGDVLQCILPSGRSIYYRNARAKKIVNKFGREQYKISYDAVNPKTSQEERVSTYGGKIVENICQAIARDLMAYAIILLDKYDGIRLAMTIHDEVVAEGDDNEENIHILEKCMNSKAPWAKACPVVAEAEKADRFKK